MQEQIADSFGVHGVPVGPEMSRREAGHRGRESVGRAQEIRAAGGAAAVGWG